MNTPVSFEIAKLLKNKNIDIQCNQIYYDGTKEIRSGSYFLYSRDLKAPTIADVLTWLHDKHGIWISVDAYDDQLQCFLFSIRIIDEDSIESEDYDTPKEAYECAIEYIISNLIK